MDSSCWPIECAWEGVHRSDGPNWFIWTRRVWQVNCWGVEEEGLAWGEDGTSTLITAGGERRGGEGGGGGEGECWGRSHKEDQKGEMGGGGRGEGLVCVLLCL